MTHPCNTDMTRVAINTYSALVTRDGTASAPVLAPRPRVACSSTIWVVSLGPPLHCLRCLLHMFKICSKLNEIKWTAMPPGNDR